MDIKTDKTNVRLKIYLPKGLKELNQDIKDKIRRVKLIAKSNTEPLQSVLYEDVIYLDYNNTCRYADIIDTVDNIMSYIKFFKYPPAGVFFKDKNISLILITTDYCFGKELAKVVNDCQNDRILSFLCTTI